MFILANLLIVIIIIGLISILFTPYEHILIQLNKLRPEYPFQFYTQDYHIFVNKVIGVLTFCFFSMGIFLITRKQQYLNLIERLAYEIYYYKSILRKNIGLFFKSNSITYISILFLMIFSGICIRILYIDRPVFHDEAKTFYAFISKSWLDTVSNYYVPNNHIFHSICARIFFVVFGNEEWVFRIPVFISGVFCSIIIYIYSYKFFNKQIALILLALTVNATPLVFYSVNARGYILVTMFFLCLLVLVKLLREKESIILWILFIILATIGIWTIPTMIMSVIFLFLWYILSSSKSQLWVDLFRLLIIGICLMITSLTVYAPVIMRSSISFITSNQYVQSYSYSNIISEIPKYIYELWIFITSGYSHEIQFVIFLLFLMGTYYLLIKKEHRAVIFSIILMFVIILLVMRKMPYDRTLLFIYPIFWTLIASGIYFLTSFLVQYFRMNKNNSVYFVSLTLFIYSSSMCLKHKGIVENSIDQTCPQAEEIISDIKKELESNDMIETSTPLAGPIRYYLIKDGIDEKQFHWHSSGSDKVSLLDSNKIFVITRKTRNTLESFEYSQQSSLNGYSKPELWKKYNDVTVYVINRI